MDWYDVVVYFFLHTFYYTECKILDYVIRVSDGQLEFIWKSVYF